MHKIKFILPLAVALLMASCVYDPGSSSNRYGQRSQTGQRPPTIWDRSTRDSDAARRIATGLTVAPRPDRYLGTYSNVPTSGGYRVYTGVSGIPDTTRLYSPPSGTYSRRDNYDPYVNSAQSGSGPDTTRRLTGPSLSDAPAPRSEMAPVSRSSIPEARDPARRPATTYPTGSAADRLASASGSRSQKESQPGPAPSSKGTPNDTGRLPFAVPVAGRTGYVRLPGHPNLPEIDVRGIAPGTPVEVPDPATSDKTIQFRVP